MIPKVLHLYWDQYPMSIFNVLTVVSFHKFNPDWRIVVYLTKTKYTELANNIFVPQYKGEDYFYLLRQLEYVEIIMINLNDFGINPNVPSCSGSDIFRTNVLYKFGGVYSDFDVIWVKPMSHLNKIERIGDPKDFECSVCMYNLTHSFHNVSVMIAEKGSAFVKSIIDAQKKVRPPYQHQSYGSTLVNKLYPDIDMIREKFPRILALRYETFFPYSIYYMKKLYKSIDLKVITNNTLAVHWFNGHHLSIEYLHDENRQPCSFDKLIEKLYLDKEIESMYN